MANKKPDERRIYMYVAFGVDVLIIASFLVLFFVGLFDQLFFLYFVYIGLGIITSALTTMFVMNYFSHKRHLEELKNDNQFRLGLDDFFYDYSSFSKRIKKLRKQNKEVNTNFFICFNSLKDIHDANPGAKKLNGEIANYLTESLTDNPGARKEKIVYCYYRQCFYLCSFMSLEDTHEYIDEIQEKIFDIVKTKELKVYVEPHFGVAEVMNSTDVVEAAEKALLAYNHACKNFEEITFFKEGIGEAYSLDDVKEISDAIKKRELVVYYQPKYSLKSKKFVGSEALVRWNSPKYGLVQPARFIKTAEVGGIIHDIDVYVFKQVIKDLLDVKRSGGRLLPVSVNFSMHEFYSPAFLKDIEQLVVSSGLPISCFEIEITEATSQANVIRSAAILKRLHDFGFKILMDDFGSGYSNISKLNELPIDTVKIDKSFIDGIINDKKNKEVVKLLIEFCRVNELEVIAEGVDSKETVSALEKMKCDVIQGYYYSKPISKEEYVEFLKDNPFEKKGEKKR